jgi:CHAD domain-containing protein
VPVIELDIAPSDLPRLLRCTTLTASRHGRTRITPCRRVWHDTADGTLRDHGMALSEQAGLWRLERLTPNGAPNATISWSPAAPAPVLGEAASPALLGRKLTPALVAALVPVAAFTGTSRSFPLLVAGEPARLDVLEGALRGVTQDEAACRITLSGAAPAMAALAARLAGQAPLGVPRAGLAARAIALAQGIAPSPPPLGAPEIPPGATVSQALVMVIGHLTGAMLHWAALIPAEAGGSPEPVHQMRVAVRRLRSALAIFRRATAPDAGALFRTLGQDLKTLAAELGAARDWDVFLQGAGADIAAAFAADKRVAALLAAADRKRRAAYAKLAAHMTSPAWRDLALRLALLPASQPWAPPAGGPPERDEFGELKPQDDHASLLAAPAASYAAQALHRSRKRMAAAGEDLAALSPDAMHDARKAAKQLRYACEFFAPLFPPKPTRRFLARLEAVQESLGAVNDSHVAAALMAQLSPGAEGKFATGLVQGYVAATSAPAARRAGKAWNKLLDQPPFWD